MTRCVLVLGRRLLQYYDLDSPEVTIGRDVGQDVRIDNDAVSRKHAVLVCSNERWTLQDLGTANGTRLNGSPVKFAPLKPGDAIQIGKHTLLFQPSREQVGRLEEGLRSVGEVRQQASTMFLDSDELQRVTRRMEEVQAAHLRLLHPHARDRRFGLEKEETLLGRSIEADIVIRGFLVAPFHAVIERDRVGFRIRALSRMRAVRVNGIRIRDRRLQHGDEIAIARRHFQFFDTM